jgi:hypothetical protein
VDDIEIMQVPDAFQKILQKKGDFLFPETLSAGPSLLKQ